jgi:hypothetical protein
MSDSDIGDKLRPAHPHLRVVEAPADHSDFRSPAAGFNSAVQWGLASLLIGSTLLVASCVTLVFNVLLFRGGPAGIPMGLAYFGGLLGTVVVLALGIFGIVSGIRGWLWASSDRLCPALPVAGTLASAVGVLTWLVAAIDLIMILHAFYTETRVSIRLRP